MASKWGYPQKKFRTTPRPDYYAPKVHFDDKGDPRCASKTNRVPVLSRNRDEVTCGRCQNILDGKTGARPEFNKPGRIQGRRTNRLLYTSEAAHDLNYGYS